LIENRLACGTVAELIKRKMSCYSECSFGFYFINKSLIESGKREITPTFQTI
jgi:hypothetical protein